MPKNNNRQGRIDEEFRKELSQIISFDLKNPSVTGMVSVTRVKVTPDLKFAKVSVSILNSKNVDETLEGLKKSVESGNLYLMQIPGNLLDVMYTKEDFERLMFLNDRNFKDSVIVANLSREQIIGLAAKQGLDSDRMLTLLLDNKVISYQETLALCAIDRVKKDTVLEVIKGKDKLSVEWALKGTNTPIGVTSYEVRNELPKEVLDKLPTEEDINKHIDINVDDNI